MSILDDRNQLATLDKSNVLGSIEQLPDQILEAWQASSQIKFNFDPQSIHHVVVAGMGGSALGARVIKSLFQNMFSFSFEFINDYNLPGYVNQNTLVILSSYSGTTEETLSGAEEAQVKGAQIAIMTAGGPLLELARSKNYPYYEIKPDHNPSNQPRMAIGYMIVGTLGLLYAAKLLQLDSAELDLIVNLLKSAAPALSPESSDSQAKKIALDAQHDFILLVSSQHLVGASHVFNNQINENAKHLTADIALPELNHHYLEALSFPETGKLGHYFLLINSTLYSLDIQLRLKLTHQILLEKGYPCELVNLVGLTPLEQAFELIQFGAYTAFYLSMLHGLDPAPIPTVDFFKAQLKLAHEKHSE